MNHSTDKLEFAWKEYNKGLLLFIRKYVDSPEVSEDILSKVYLKLASQVSLSRIPQKLPNWLYTVAKNTIVDFYRTYRPMEELTDFLQEDTPEPQAISALSKCILPIIDELPEIYRQPILLSEINGLKQSEAAAELCLSLPAFKSRVLRGRRKLKEMMAKRCTYYYDKDGNLLEYEEINQE